MKRPALGHILGYTALTVILTAGAAQSLSGANTVFSDDIVDGNVTSADIKDQGILYADIKDGAMTGKKILDNSVTGADVNESSLLPTCPSAMTKVGDVCYTSLRDKQVFSAALSDCVDEHLRLPTISEAEMIVTAGGDLGPDWTDVRFVNGSTAYAAVITTGPLKPDAAAATTGIEYRCVTTVGARP